MVVAMESDGIDIGIQDVEQVVAQEGRHGLTL